MHTHSSASPQPLLNGQIYASPSYSPARSLSPSGVTPTSSTHSLPSTNGKPKPKPANVFSNDGSFLERFQNTRREEELKKKAKEDLQRKLNFNDRFKTRAKRKSSATEEEVDHAEIYKPSENGSNGSPSPAIADGEPPAKKAKSEDTEGDRRDNTQKPGDNAKDRSSGSVQE